MNGKTYAVFSDETCSSGEGPEPVKGERRIVTMSAASVPGCIFTAAGWYTQDASRPRLHRHDSDQVLLLLGSDHDSPEDLHAEITLRIENDTLCLTKTSAVYVPKGAAHGDLQIRNLSRPVMFCLSYPDTDIYREAPAEAHQPAGRFANVVVDRYDTSDVELPPAAPEVMTRLLFLDTRRVPGAPYYESVWFNVPTPAFLKPHVHDLDELIYFAGADPDRPGELGGIIDFYIDGKPIRLDRSCLLFIPKGVPHNPFEILEMSHPCLHFSGGNGNKYTKK